MRLGSTSVLGWHADWRAVARRPACSQVSLHYRDLTTRRPARPPASCSSALLQALGRRVAPARADLFWLPALIIGRGVFHRCRAVIVLLVVPAGGSRSSGCPARMGPRERLLLVGTSAAAVALARELFERRHELGVEIVGFVDPDPARVGEPVINPGVIGTIEDIPSIVRARDVDRVVVSLADARGKLPMDKLLEMKLDGVSLRSPGVGLRGVHRQDRRREPAPELADLLRRLPARRGSCRRQAACIDVCWRCSGCCSLRRSWLLVALGDPADLAGPGALSPAARRPARARLHGAQVPVDARGRGGGDRRRCGREARRPARDADRPFLRRSRGSTNCRSSGTCSTAT